MVKVLVMPDAPGWALDSIADSVIEHADPEFEFTKRYTTSYTQEMKITPQDDKEYDVVWIMLMNEGCYIAHQFMQEYGYNFGRYARFVAGVVGHRALELHMLVEELAYFDAINVISKDLWHRVSPLHPRVHYTRLGVDPQKFYPGEFHADRFNVGWAGKPIHHWKRVELLDKLNYEVLRTDAKLLAEEVPEFYRGLDVLVVTSKDEGGPMVVPEACASGLPVVSTRVGMVPEIIDEKWIISPDIPESRIIDAFNYLLGWLEDHPRYRCLLGKRNLHESEKWTWEKVAPGWVSFLEGPE